MNNTVTYWNNLKMELGKAFFIYSCTAKNTQKTYYELEVKFFKVRTQPMLCPQTFENSTWVWGVFEIFRQREIMGHKWSLL